MEWDDTGAPLFFEYSGWLWLRLTGPVYQGMIPPV